MAATKGTSSISTGNSLTLAHTVASGATHLLVRLAVFQTASAVTLSSSVDGSFGAAIVNRTNSNNVRVYIFGIANPTAGAHTLTLASVTAANTFGIEACDIFGASAFGASASQFSSGGLTGATAATAPASVVGDLVLDVLCTDAVGGTTETANGSQVVSNNQNSSISANYGLGGSSLAATAPTTSVGWTWTPNARYAYGAVVMTGAIGPVITVQPVADVGIISNGQSTVYTATATGTNVLAPTWSEDATPIADGGIYDIVTTGAGTSSCSSTLTITRTVKTGTPFDIKAAFTDDNGSTDTNTVTDTWWTGPSVTTFPATDGDGESTATLTCDYVTGVGEAIEVRIPLSDGDVAVTVTTT
jgi:hypothetical protein